MQLRTAGHVSAARSLDECRDRWARARGAYRVRRPTVMAEFASASALLDGLRVLGASGVSRLDAFTPYEVDGIHELLHLRRSRLPWIVIAAGLAGGVAAYLFQWWFYVADAPLALAGRAGHGVLSPVTSEMAVLVAAASAVIAVLVVSGLPRLWHPAFEIEGFERAAHDRFWLAVAAGDPALDHDRDTAALEAAGALRVLWLAT